MEYKKWDRENLYYIYKSIRTNGCKKNFYFAKKKTYFFYFTHPLLQNTHINLATFPSFFNYFTPIHGPPTLTHMSTPFSLNIFPFFFSFFFFHFSSFSFFSYFFFFFIILSIHILLSIFPIPSINLPQLTAPINQTQSKAEA